MNRDEIRKACEATDENLIDSEFVLRAREWVPALLAENDELVAAVEALTEERDVAKAEMERLRGGWSDDHESWERTLEDCFPGDWDSDCTDESLIAHVKALHALVPLAVELAYVDSDAMAEAPMVTLALRRKVLNAADVAWDRERFWSDWMVREHRPAEAQVAEQAQVIEGLREALEPFAKYADAMMDGLPDHVGVARIDMAGRAHVEITRADLYAARTALASLPPKETTPDE